MNAPAPFPSIAAVGADLGRRIGQHKLHTFRTAAHGPDVVLEPGQLRFITGAAHPFGNFALLNRGDDLAEASRAVVPLVACAAPAVVLFPGAGSTEVDQLLRARGFEPQSPMPAMAVDIERMAPASCPAGYELVRVGGGIDGEAWAEAFAVGYELPAIVAKAFAPQQATVGFSPDSIMQYFAIRKAGRWVGTSMVCLHEGLAGVYCVSTVPDERGKGLGAYVTAEPLRLARQAGFGVGILQSTAAGYGVYRRLGFTEFASVSLYLRLPR